jgi:hypothetical protein
MATPKLRLLRHDSPSGPTCPAFYDAGEGQLAVVGKIITDPAVLAQMGIAADEMAVMIPDSLVPEVKNA